MSAPRQGKLFKLSEISNLARQFTPVADIEKGAEAYQATQGKAWNTAGLGDTRRNPEHGHATYLAYRDAMNAPEKSGLRQSYSAMAEHMGKQYEHLTTPKEKGGMGFTHTVTPHDPYDSPTALAEDLKRGHIKTLATATTGSHEVFSNEENDKFRAVHDVFGHGATGRGFSRHGEEAAFLAHRQMFPPEAHAALASETRGQNSYLNYSPQNEFASQEGRLVGLPNWASRKGQRAAPRSPYKPTSKKITKRSDGEQLSLF
jgi:hypothetical protein